MHALWYSLQMFAGFCNKHSLFNDKIPLKSFELQMVPMQSFLLILLRQTHLHWGLRLSPNRPGRWEQCPKCQCRHCWLGIPVLPHLIPGIDKSTAVTACHPYFCSGSLSNLYFCETIFCIYGFWLGSKSLRFLAASVLLSSLDMTSYVPVAQCSRDGSYSSFYGGPHFDCSVWAVL